MAFSKKEKKKKRHKHTSVGLWSFKGGKLRIILLNILLCKNINITLLSTNNVLPLYWTFTILCPIFFITWIVLSLFYRRGNWGSKRLSDLPKVTHILSGTTGIQIRSFSLPSLRCPSVLTKGCSPATWHDTQHDMTSFMKLRKPQEYLTFRADS